LALVHMPEMDSWTVNSGINWNASQGGVRRIGINLGAPGDRRDPNGVLWLEYPAVAGDAPNLNIELEGSTQFYQDHPTWMFNAELPWVAASGVEGLSRLRLNLRTSSTEGTPQVAKPAVRVPYRVRLHFGIPRSAQAERRAFDVVVQEEHVIENVVLGGEMAKSQIRTLDRVLLGDWMEIQFKPKTGQPLLSGIELQRLEE
jgi:hypothetical protein